MEALENCLLLSDAPMMGDPFFDTGCMADEDVFAPLGGAFSTDEPELNTLPTLIAPDSLAISLDTQLVFSGATAPQVASPDGPDSILRMTLMGLHGRLSLDGMSGLTFSTGDGTYDNAMIVTGRVTDLNAALDGLIFFPNSGFFGTTTLQITCDDGGGLAASSAVSISVTSDGSPPATPSAAHAGAVSGSQVAFSWTDEADNETSYEVQRADFWWGGFATVANLPPNSTSFTDTSVSAGNGYRYRVRAVNSSGNSDWTAETGVFTVAAHAVGNPFHATTWQDSSGGYSAWISEFTTWQDGAWFRFSNFNFSAQSVSAFSATAASDGSSNAMEIRLDSPSGTLIGTLAIPDTNWAYQAATTKISAVSGTHEVYLVYRTPDWNSTNFRSFSFGANQAPVNTLPATQATARDTALVFRSSNGNLISVDDPDNDGSYVKVALTATHGTLTLAQTTSLSFQAGDGASDGTMTFTGYLSDVQHALAGMSFAPDSGFTGLATLTVTTNDLGFIGSGGAKQASGTVAINVNADFVLPPADPTHAHAAAASESAIRLTWQDESNNETGFEIQRSPLGWSDNWSTLATVGANTTSYLDGSLGAGEAYRYRVRALGAGGPSNWTGNETVAAPRVMHDAAQLFFASHHQDASAGISSFYDGISFPNGGEWIKFSAFDFSALSSAALTASVTSPTAGNKFEIRLDSPTGALIGELAVPDTGGYWNFQSVTATLAPTDGVHDLYLVYRDLAGWGGNLRALTFAANQAPTNVVPRTQIMAQDGTLLFSAQTGNRIAVEDSDAYDNTEQVRLTVTHGTLSLASAGGLTYVAGDGTADTMICVRGALANLNQALAQLIFQPDAGFIGTAMLAIETSDLGAFGAGGALTDGDTINITVTQAYAPPAAPDHPHAAGLSETQIQLMWMDASDNEEGFEVQRASMNADDWATLTVTGADVQTFIDGTLAAGASCRYRVRAVNGTGNSAWTDVAAATTRSRLALSDTIAGSMYQDSSGASLWASYQTAGGFHDGDWLAYSGFDFSSAVADGFSVTLNSTAAGNSLEIRLDGPMGRMIGRVAIPATGEAFSTFTTPIDFVSGVHDVYLVFRQPTWQGVILRSFTFAANQPPAISVPAAQTLRQDRTLIFSADAGTRIMLADVDANDNVEQVTLRVTCGTLTLASRNGLTFLAGDGSQDAIITMRGNVADLNAALNGLMFTPMAGASSDATLSITANDLGATGYGGARTVTQTVEIHVIEVDRPPTIVTPAAASAARVLGSTVVLSVSADDDHGEGNLTYTWSCTSGPNEAHPAFSSNQSHAARNTTVTFDKTGIYTFLVTVSDGTSVAISSVSVSVVSLLAPTTPATPTTPTTPTAPTAPTNPTTPATPTSPTTPGTGSNGTGSQHTTGGGGGTKESGGNAMSNGSSGEGGKGGVLGSPGSAGNVAAPTAGGSSAAAAAVAMAGAGGNQTSAGGAGHGDGGVQVSGQAAASAPLKPGQLAAGTPGKPTTAAAAQPAEQLIQGEEDGAAAANAAQASEQVAREVEQKAQEIVAQRQVTRRVIGTIVSVSATATASYVIWIARGGSLLVSMITSAPVWRFVDPLPVLTSWETRHSGRKRRREETSSIDGLDERIEHFTD